MKKCGERAGCLSAGRNAAARVMRVLCWALLTGAGLAHADGGKPVVPANIKWQDECGSCHVAYPPYLLAAEDWQKMMRELDRHFGSNAALGARDNKEITAFLLRHAGEGKRFSSPSLRITETPWFRREHRNISPREWALPQVKSRANCGACHIDIGRQIRQEREQTLRELPYSK